MRKRVLVADDSSNIRGYCREVLEQAGYHVVTAKDGVEALEVVEEDPPDAAILDLRMPRKSGFEVAEELRASQPEVPVIFFTNYEDQVIDERILLAKACIEKSDGFVALADTVAWAIATSHPQEHGSGP